MPSNLVKAALYLALLLSVTTVACKKEKEEPPAFDAVGYWRGHTYLYTLAILNRQDGSSRFYLKMPGTDTAKALTKLDGTFTAAGGGMKAFYNYFNTADKALVETYTADDKTMTGLLSYPTGEATTFDLRKQLK